MTPTDQAEFVITATGIHCGVTAWKYGAPFIGGRSTPAIFSVRLGNRTRRATGFGAHVTSQWRNLEPIQFDRPSFGELKPIANGPESTG